jgi:hypothetical protein
LEGAEFLSQKAVKLQLKVSELHTLYRDPHLRTEEQKDLIDNKESKYRLALKQVFISYKFIGDLIFNEFLPISFAEDIIEATLLASNFPSCDDGKVKSLEPMLVNLSYFELCKISVLYGSLSNKVFEDTNGKCYKYLSDILHFENEYIRWYNHKDHLLAGTIILELKALKDING